MQGMKRPFVSLGSWLPAGISETLPVCSSAPAKPPQEAWGAHGQGVAPTGEGPQLLQLLGTSCPSSFGWWQCWGAQANVSSQSKHFQLSMPSSSRLFEWDPKLKEVPGTDVIRDCHQIWQSSPYYPCMSAALESQGMSRHPTAFILCFPRAPKDLLPKCSQCLPFRQLGYCR